MDVSTTYTETALPTPAPSPGRGWMIAAALLLVVLTLLFADVWPCDCMPEERHDVEPATLLLVKPTVVLDNVLAGYAGSPMGITIEYYYGLLPDPLPPLGTSGDLF